MRASSEPTSFSSRASDRCWWLVPGIVRSWCVYSRLRGKMRRRKGLLQKVKHAVFLGTRDPSVTLASLISRFSESLSQSYARSTLCVLSVNWLTRLLLLWQDVAYWCRSMRLKRRSGDRNFNLKLHILSFLLELPWYNMPYWGRILDKSSSDRVTEMSDQVTLCRELQQRKFEPEADNVWCEWKVVLNVPYCRWK